ncbi:SWI/SNF-related matrix-associated actin-dependent regulator of chromatin subfamily A-like protein 1 [Diorhabda carinulata]|uniref:SWI/SNF-related matrix-associated actin-dependent regulator of chromatin subfamily A-like protein 1 n=1 Tax=Diorhabda carinulata TaxID=1163345 RepID=UPI0025A0860D|nr:SWI/SNF-related matrix-associated actin-dependent regulator of chromatin subfamily A-like protein 1 [Diorhabda carinulata]
MANFNFYKQTLTATLSLISKDRFKVDVSGFDQEIIDIFKTIPSKFYEPKTRLWNFLISDYDLLLFKLQNLKDKLIVEGIPKFALNCVKMKEHEVEIDFKRLDPTLNATLMPFQIEGLRFGIDKNGRCLIADDMGLGKTFQALAISNYYSEDWPLLIVTTSTMKTQWEETIANYLPSVSILQVQYIVSGKDYIGDAKILIVSHDMMSRCLSKLLERKFGVIIIDESHILKGYKSKCYQSAFKLACTAKRIILLSGTPALSRPSELYTQLNLIDKSFFGNFFIYSKRYCDGKTTKFGWDHSGNSNLQELEVILAKKFMIRRTKDQVLSAIPNKKQEIIDLDTKISKLPEKHRKCLMDLEEKYINQKGAGKHALLLTFFSETAKIKIPAVCSYILNMLERKEKFLIFAHHQVMLNAIEDVAKKKNVKYIRIDGNTTNDQRKYYISKFQLDNNYICAILSITAANAGITLTAAKFVIFAELHWNPSIISQAESRAHRIGQGQEVIVRYLLARGTADDSIWPLLQEKQRTLNAVGLCPDSFKEVTVSKQKVSDSLNSAVGSSDSDIRNYFTPEKKRKIDRLDDIFDDGFDDMLSRSTREAEDMLNDGLDDIFCDVDF